VTPPAAPGGAAEAFGLAQREEAEEGAYRGRSGPYPAPTADNGGGPPRRSVLPGSGTPGDGCGETVPTHVCQSHGIALVARHECEHRGCPNYAGPCQGGSECPVGLPPHSGGEWAHEDARLARRRFEDFIEQHRLARIPFRQVVVSFATDRFKETEDHGRVIGKVRQLAIRAQRKLAWRGKFGGAIVVHLYRGCERDGYGTWGPHAHVVCFGVDVRRVEAYHGSTDVLVKQVNGASGGFAIYRGRKLQRLLTYELSHAAILEPTDGRKGANHALTWFGDFHTWKQPPEKERGPRKCPVGGEDLEQWPWNWNYDSPIAPDDGEVRVSFPGGGLGTFRIWREGPSPPPWGRSFSLSRSDADPGEPPTPAELAEYPEPGSFPNPCAEPGEPVDGWAEKVRAFRDVLLTGVPLEDGSPIERAFERFEDREARERAADDAPGPSVHDERAWRAPVISATAAGRELREELDRLEHEDREREARRNSYLRVLRGEPP